MTDLPIVGERILRAVRVAQDELSLKAPKFNKILIEQEFKKNERGSFTFRAIRDMMADEQFVAHADADRGLVCFCNQEIPEGYTHFIIEKVLKAGACVLVKPLEGDIDELLSMYKAPDERRETVREIIKTHPKLIVEEINLDILARHMTGAQLRELFEVRADVVEHITTEEGIKLEGDISEATDRIINYTLVMEELLKPIALKEARYTKVLQKVQSVRSDTISILKG